MDNIDLNVDPTKIQATHNWIAPMTLIELYNPLGLANFY